MAVLAEQRFGKGGRRVEAIEDAESPSPDLASDPRPRSVVAKKKSASADTRRAFTATKQGDAPRSCDHDPAVLACMRPETGRNTVVIDVDRFEARQRRLDPGRDLSRRGTREAEPDACRCRGRRVQARQLQGGGYGLLDRKHGALEIEEHVRGPAFGIGENLAGRATQTDAASGAAAVDP